MIRTYCVLFSDTRELVMVEMPTGRTLWSELLEGDSSGRQSCCLFSPDSRLIARGLTIVEARTGKVVRKMGSIVGFAAQGPVVRGYDGLRFVDLATGHETLGAPVQEYNGI